MIGFVFTFYFYFKEGLNATHTPPNTIVWSIGMLIISVAWINIDYILSYVLSLYKTTYIEHQFSIVINLIYIISIIAIS